MGTELKRAGGYRISSGCAAYPNFTVPQRKPWIRVVSRLLEQRVKANDRAVITMLQNAHAEWLTFEPVPYHRLASLTPLGKAQALIAHVLRQGNYGVIDIVSSGVAAILMSESGQFPRPPKLPYFRAVQVGLAVRNLHKPEFKVYEREDSRTGQIISHKVNITLPLRVRSRYMCQRVEHILRKHVDPFILEHGPSIILAEMERKSRMKSRG
jgi:hypothetical protein